MRGPCEGIILERYPAATEQGFATGAGRAVAQIIGLLLRRRAQALAAIGDCVRSKRSKLARSSGSELAIAMPQPGACKPAGAGAMAGTSGRRTVGEATSMQMVQRGCRASGKRIGP